MRTTIRSDERTYFLFAVIVQAVGTLHGEALEDAACSVQDQIQPPQGVALLSMKRSTVAAGAHSIGEVDTALQAPLYVENKAQEAEPAKNQMVQKSAKPKKSKKGEEDPGFPSMELLTTMFWVIMPLVLIAFVIFELIHRQCAGVDLSTSVIPEEQATEQQGSMRLSQFLSGIWPMTRSFFLDSPQRTLGQVLLATMLALAVFDIFLDWCSNSWYRSFWDSMQQQNVSEFWSSMILFWQISTCKILVGTYAAYISTMLAIRWRADLTRNLQTRWLIGRAFCTTQFPRSSDGIAPPDNPDQRLQEDVDIFISYMLDLTTNFLLSAGRLLVFLPMLAMLSPTYAFGRIYCPGWLVYLAIVYSFSGSLITHLVGSRLIPLNFAKQRSEADFRFAAMQVRDHAESIALYRAEEAENGRLTTRFNVIQRVIWEQMRYSKYLNFFSSFYMQIGVVFPFCILAPNYFGGQITLGALMQVLSALDHVKGALDFFVVSYSSLASLRATVDRLQGFSSSVDAGCKRMEIETISPDREVGQKSAIYASNIRLSLKAQGEPADGDKTTSGDRDRELWKNADLKVQPAERVLLAGPDGCGKSLFMRALSGLWPAQGQVSLGADSVLFMPQKPFVPGGTLHAAMAYPEPAETYSEAEVRDALQEVRIPALENVPLQEFSDWQRRLSGGELQRLALGHALLRKANLVVLDESTSAMGEQDAADLYAILARKLPQTAIITIGHDTTGKVAESHTTVYTYDKTASRWSLLKTTYKGVKLEADADPVPVAKPA